MAELTEHDKNKIFSDLFELYFIRLKKFALSFVKDHGLAEEVVMDVFLKLWERRTKLDTIDNLSTYLFVATRNTCHNYLRKINKQRFDSLDHVDVKLSYYDHLPDDDLLNHEMLLQLNSAVDALPPKCKMIFKLIREEGLSRKDTAKVLNISVNTIDNQIAIAVNKIAETLGIDLTLKKNRSSLRSILL